MWGPTKPTCGSAQLVEQGERVLLAALDDDLAHLGIGQQLVGHQPDDTVFEPEQQQERGQHGGQRQRLAAEGRPLAHQVGEAQPGGERQGLGRPQAVLTPQSRRAWWRLRSASRRGRGGSHGSRASSSSWVATSRAAPRADAASARQAHDDAGIGPVEIGRGLVRQHEGRPMHERLAHRHTLPLPEREVGGPGASSALDAEVAATDRPRRRPPCR